MNKTQYNEPMFKVVISSSQDVITTSVEANPTYNQGQFETNPQPFVGF